MLTQVTIQNFGLIDKLSLEFNKHLNILTGETGAGKSIVIDALRIALGDRISSGQLRDENKPCLIEAVFHIRDKHLRELPVMEDFLKDDDTIIIQRTYTADGRNKIKINGLNVTVAQLKELGNYLMDFHGPHDHQMLLATESHIDMLDRLIDFNNLPQEYSRYYAQYKELSQKISTLEELASTKERELDLLTHQVKELEQVPLDSAKYEELQLEQIRLNNAERLHECIATLLDTLDADGQGSSDRLRKAFSPMRTLNQLDESTQKLMDMLAQVQDQNDQLIIELRHYADSLSFEPQTAERISEQCDMYENIKRKYGPTIDEAKQFYTRAKEKLDLLTNIEHNDKDARQQLAAIVKKIKEVAAKMTKERQKASLLLKKTIEQELKELGIPHVKFESRVEPGAIAANGVDRVAFYLSPNAGEDLKPLAEIVSSGEAARVMLALKKALIKVDPIPVLIFDEIDAQIGGRLGTVTGEKLREISKSRQVLLITHLPQIASFADVHFKVIKLVENGRAVTQVKELDKNERVEELAQMMSGAKKTDIAIKHAHDMLASANQ